MLNGPEIATRDPGHSQDRPAGVTLIGWIWLFTAAVTALAGALGLVLADSVSGVSKELDGLLAGSWALGVSTFLLVHLTTVALLHLALALVKGLAGLGLLRGWPGSRGLTVGLCWLSMVYDLAVGIHLLGVWWATAGTLFAEDGALLYQISGSALLLLLIMALIVPLPIMIWYLRRTKDSKEV